MAGFLNDSQKAAIRTSIQTDEGSARLWRNPPEANSKTARRVDTLIDIPIRIRPTGQDDSNLKKIAIANPVNLARVSRMGKVAVAADVRTGDELRMDGVRYLVEGIGTFTNARLVALSEIKGSA